MLRQVLSFVQLILKYYILDDFKEITISNIYIDISLLYFSYSEYIFVLFVLL